MSSSSPLRVCTVPDISQGTDTPLSATGELKGNKEGKSSCLFLHRKKSSDDANQKQ